MARPHQGGCGIHYSLYDPSKGPAALRLGPRPSLSFFFFPFFYIILNFLLYGIKDLGAVSPFCM
jgi:hypothetical protein